MAGRDVQFVKKTPAFIKNFKNQIGYKEPDSIESKFKKLEKSSKEDEEDQECEKPTVVLGTNVTEEEANEFLAKRHEGEHEEDNTENDDQADAEEDGKFVFRKPKKRKSEDKSTKQDHNKKLKDKHKTTKSSSKAVKNASLLSFGDEEEEEG